MTEKSKAESVIELIEDLARCLPGTAHPPTGEAVRLAYMDSVRCILKVFGLPDLPTDESGFIRQDTWPPNRKTKGEER